MSNDIRARFTVRMDPSDSSLYIEPEILIDGRLLSEHFKGSQMQTEPALGRRTAPATASKRLTVRHSQRSAQKCRMSSLSGRGSPR